MGNSKHKPLLDLYAGLLRLYPARFRREFGPQMLSARLEVYVFDTDAPLRFSSKATGAKGWMQLVAVERHRGAPNITFADGHAETVPLAMLWKLKWSATFQPKEVRIAN